MRNSHRLLALAAVSSSIVVGVAASPASADTDRAVAKKPVSQTVPDSDLARLSEQDIERIVKTATPMPMPTHKQGKVPAESRGKQAVMKPSAPQATGERVNAGLRASNAGALWPLGPTVNPNRQVGKLYFDVDPGPGESFSWCTATAVNSENKSTVLTAGHCVVNASTRQFYQRSFFRPGYQYGPKLGTWSVRYKVVTGNYYWYGSYADDMAAVVVRPLNGRTIVSRLGGHGAWFNGSTNQYRTSLGYPITDSRWPGYVANGEDARYCQGTDYYYGSGTWAGQNYLPCYMTGGSSGGPWLTWVQNNWLGYVNSVNSNKGGVGSAWRHVMFGPYFGNQELDVFNLARNA